ncbi:Ger(x)C family spore germination protein [Fictibacillus terranigra]|uniref:Ger(X)C family spore germination protein n=1 Tax=Fictibacillus terranigra TaxID=3058424 RepID=A0ABT8EBR0_9BACL|nr:Ger(x)C family spore germination protein [Fictibacillus sp. CENA-BCM004]MDN4075289.1 Ger(x)C family spore germination protein [Fictibacillus sp. CENA-BCM004]
MGNHGNIIRLLCVIVLLVPLLTGCWDSVDIEDRAVVLAIAIDKAEKNAKENEAEISHLKQKGFRKPQEKMIRVTAQIAVPGRIPLGPDTGGGTGEEKPPVWVLSAVGHTLDDALLNLQQEVADPIFLGHLRVIIISKDLAKKGVKRFNDYFRRNPEIRRSAWLAISNGNAAKLINVAPKLERVPALYIAAMLENGVKLGKFPNDFIGLFWRTLSSKGQDAYLPFLKVKEEENIQIKGLANFSNAKMVGMTEPLEIGLYMGVMGERKGGYGVFVDVPGTKAKVLVEAVHRKSRVKTVIRNGKPHVQIKIRYEGQINEKDHEKVEINKSAVIKRIEKKAATDTEKSVKGLIRKTQQMQSDIFGFGEYVRAKHPTYWNENVKTKENWHKLYKEGTYEVKVVFHIRRVGMKAE